MATFSERLKEAMEHRNLKQSDVVRLSGLDKSLIFNYVSGKYKAKQENLYILADVLCVSEAWLMGLNVPMECDTRQSALSNNVNSQCELTEHEKSVIGAYRAKPELQPAVDILLGLSE